MPKLTEFAAIIFDMDGLVLDTESTYRLAWQQAAALMGYDFSDSFCLSLSGLSYDQVITRIQTSYGQHFNIDEFNRVSGRCWQQEVNTRGIAVKPGVRPLLDTITRHNIPYCLATNSAANNARECLTYADLSDVFTTIISRDDVTATKPAPDIFLRAAEKLQVNIADCLILEDSYTGISAGWFSGATVVWVPSYEHPNTQLPDHYHFKVKDLEQLLETFGV